MFAVIKTGGKQYRVAEGDVLVVEKISPDHIKDGEIKFDSVLLAVDGDNVSIGAPGVKGASVVGQVVEEGKGKKKMVFRYKSKTFVHQLINLSLHHDRLY